MTEPRIERIGDAILYLGDCYTILPEIKADAVVTDPPYGIDFGSMGGKAATALHRNVKSSWRQHETFQWDKDRPPREAFDLMRSISQDQIIWGGNYFTDHLPPTMRWLIWDKGQRNFSLADFEIAWTSQWNASRIFDYSRARAAAEAEYHPTQKPVALMEWCLDFLPDAAVICDPFMGSGSTGVAAARHGRQFIGIERERKYFDIACERISAAYAQGRLFA
jgi:DNA modification methylase